jgi:pimeloyl-ACP methyl ester carboxylesterase
MTERRGVRLYHRGRLTAPPRQPEEATMSDQDRAQMNVGAYAAVNGLKVYYEVSGTGRPLVLLHGGLQTIDLTFGPMIPVLAEDHQVIGIELQGHGHTADVERPMRLEHLADDVAAVLGVLGV